MKHFRQTWVAIRALVVLTVVLGVLYPLAVTAFGQLALNHNANGQLVSAGGHIVGSAIIGQSFTAPDGTALPQWFQSRPSAAGTGYDGGASGGSNYGPENPVLISAIADRQRTISMLEGVSTDQIPPDAVTASASGLDPDISPEYALLQVPRVAAARGVDEATLRSLVTAHIDGRTLGYLGEQTVNVLELNIALSKLG
jgi:potassium-transporting ATPase KdpC subunit